MGIDKQSVVLDGIKLISITFNWNEKGIMSDHNLESKRNCLLHDSPTTEHMSSSFTHHRQRACVRKDLDHKQDFV